MRAGATLPPLFDYSLAENRAKTAPAGTVNSARRAQSSREAYRAKGFKAPASAGGSPRRRPFPHAVSTDPSPPSTAKSVSLVPSLPNKGTADVMQMVHGYWAPVEEAVRTRHPRKLEIALRDLHGSEYLRTIYSVRRSAALKAAERNAIEMELAARLVRARAVLGKWQGGMREILEAHQSRDAERLEKSLAKWSFTQEVPEIAEAKEDLGRWRDLADTLPLVLKDAVEKLDVPQLRKAVAELNSSGPNGVEGACGARKILSRYNAQAKALDDAIAAGNSRSIREAMAAWSFDRDDSHIDAGLAALQKFEEQKAALRTAVETLEGVALQKAVDEWSFERDAAPFVEAMLALNRYTQASRHLNELAQAPELSIHRLADEINTWEFTQDDPVLSNVRGVLGAFEDAVREAVEASDGWTLENLLSSSNDKKTFVAVPDLRSKASNLLQRYQDCVAELQEELRCAEDLNAAAAPRIASLVANWAFAPNDPHLEIANYWLRLHRFARERNLVVLRRAVDAGDVFSLQRLIPAVRHSTGDCSELRAAEEVCRVYDDAVRVVGAVALGVEPQHLKGVLDHTARLNESVKTIHRVIDSIEFRWIACLKALSKPPPIVHAVLQMIVHIVAGINPHIKDPPRDTDWKTCQKMMVNTSAFLSNLKSVPEYLAAGRTSGIARARTLALSFHLEYGEDWSCEGIAATNQCASVMYTFLVHVLDYLDILDSSDNGLQSSPPRSQMTCSSTMSIELDAALREKDDAQAADSLPLTDQSHPLIVLQRAKRTLSLSPILSLAWVLSGRNADELNGCLQRMLTYACAGEAAKTVTSQLVSHFAPVDHTNTSLALESDSKEMATENLGLQAAFLTVKLISGEVVANFEVDSTTTVGELKQRLAAIEGTPVQQQQLFLHDKKLADGMKLDLAAVVNGFAVTLIRLAPTLPELLQNAFYSCCSPNTSKRPGASAKSHGLRGDHFGTSTRSRDEIQSGRPVTSGSCREGALTERLGSSRSQDDSLSDPLAYFLLGNATDKITSRSKKNNVQSDIARMLRAAKDVMQSTSGLQEGSTKSEHRHIQLEVLTTPVAMDHEVVKNFRVPLHNMVLAKRFLSIGMQPAAESLISAMECYYDEYIPLRAAWLQAVTLHEDSQQALRESEKAVSLANSVSSVVRSPTCIDVEGVKRIAAHTMEQVEHLARKGIALPAMHVELVRQAIDAAGLHLLSNPPAADPGARIQWSEMAMAIQLTPLSHFGTALKGIACSISKQDLDYLSLRNEMPSTEFVRLMGAVMWVIQPECTSNATWAEVRLLLADTAKLTESLQSWNPIRDVSVSRSTRARSVLLEIWSWVADGCAGSLTSCILFAWVSLVVAIAPLADMAQRLSPVYKAVKQGIAKSQQAPANRKKIALGRAWTSALFLLDGPGEHWWWLQLIRPAASMDRPWTDGEDGGVGESHDHQDDSNQRRSGSKDSLQEDSVAKLVNQSLSAEDPGEEDCEEFGDEEGMEPDEVNEEMQTQDRIVESPDAPESIDKLTNEDVELVPVATATPTGELERSLTASVEPPSEAVGNIEMPSEEV